MLRKDLAEGLAGANEGEVTRISPALPRGAGIVLRERREQREQRDAGVGGACRRRSGMTRTARGEGRPNDSPLRAISQTASYQGPAKAKEATRGKETRALSLPHAG